MLSREKNEFLFDEKNLSRIIAIQGSFYEGVLSGRIPLWNGAALDKNGGSLWIRYFTSAFQSWSCSSSLIKDRWRTSSVDRLGEVFIRNAWVFQFPLFSFFLAGESIYYSLFPGLIWVNPSIDPSISETVIHQISVHCSWLINSRL